MKRVVIRRHGRPEEVVEVLEEADPLPGPGQVRVRNHVMTINPADLLSIEGRYGAEPVQLPLTPGVGAWGRVDAVGDGVTRLSIGDAVLPVGGGLWSDTIIVHERMAPKAPDGADPAQAAMMRANPGTAYLMLTDLVALQPGDWVVQNAANSNVGRMVVRFAREMGLRTINIVRRANVAASLQSDGAGIIIVDDGTIDVAAAIRAASDTPPKLALDAVGGTATRGLATAMAQGGTVVVYGLLSGDETAIAARDLVFRGVTLRGFWLADWYQTATRDQMTELHSVLVQKLAEGVLHTDIEARYPIEQIKDAVAHAGRGGRNGKIILTGESDA